jgi:hypothetical protein
MSCMSSWAQNKTASKSSSGSPLWLVANPMTRADARISSWTGRLNVRFIFNPTNDSFSYGIVVLLGQALEVLVAVESRSSGSGHRSRLRTYRTPPAGEAHVLLDDQSGAQIDACLNSNSPLALSAPHGVFVMHTSRLRRIASVAYRRDRQCARIRHWVYLYVSYFRTGTFHQGGHPSDLIWGKP